MHCDNDNSGQWSLDAFAARFLAAVGSTRLFGPGLSDKRETLFTPVNDHYELTSTLQRPTMSGEQEEKKREWSLIDCSESDVDCKQ